VEGNIAVDEDIIDLPIAHHPVKLGVMIISRHGKESKTAFKVLERFKNCSLIELQIFSGRTHQIRVHMQAYEHPLLVDEVYGGKPGFYLSSVKRKYNKAGEEPEKPLMSRQSLHASRLVFNDPATGERISVEAELPKDFRAVLNQLGKLQKRD
jgi:23S rRNA pseudouridine1911/1915/1917 synthase